jgi:hypothetical protein
MPEEKVINLGAGVNATQPESEPKVVNLGGQAKFQDVSFDVPSIDSKTGIAGGNMSAEDIWNNLTPEKSKVPQLPTSSIYIGNRYKSSRPYETDLEEKYAQQQSALDQWKNGALKFVGTATNSFISGTAGTVYGLGAMVRDGRFASLFDNEINRKLDDSYKALEDALPNYMTQKQTDANWYSPDYLLTANFFSDGILKNLGYSLGTIGGGFAWSKAIKALGITSKLVKAGQGLEAMTAVEESMSAVPRLQKFAAFDGALNSVAQKYLKSPAASVLRNSDRIITSATGTFGEAGLEGLHNMNVFRENAIEEYRNKYGETPTGKDLDSINEYTDKVGNFTWGMNSLLLTATNYIQLPKILGSSRKADAALINDIEQSVVGGEWAKYLPKTRIGKIGSGIRNVGGLIVSPSEGFEEGSQFAIQTGVNDYFNRAYRNRKDVSSFLNNMNDVMGNITSYGIDQALYTKEGMSNILIGALSGGLQQAGYAGSYQDEQGKTKFGFGKSGELGERGFFGYGGERGRNTDIAIEALNKTKSSAVLKDLANYIGIGIGSQKARQAAIVANDKVTEKDMEHDFTLSYLMPRVKYGRIEAVNQELSYYKSQAMDNVGFEELIADGIVNANETKEQFVQRLDNLSALAKQVEDTYSMVRERYSNLVDKEGNKLYSDKVIDKLVYSTAKVGNYDVRIPQVNSILNEAGINTGQILQSIIAGNEPNKQATQDVLDQINSMDVISDVKEDLKTALADVVDLSLNRRKYIQEYDAIKQDPKGYEEMDEEFGAEEEVPVTVEQKVAAAKKKGKAKIVEKKLEIGKVYSLKEPVLVQDGKLIFKPTLSVLSQTLGGELEVQLPTGDIAFMTPQQFRDYNISEDETAEELGYILDKAIDKVLNKKKYSDIAKPEEGQSKMDYVNSLNDPELVNDIVKEFDEQSADFLKNREAEIKNQKGNAQVLSTSDTESVPTDVPVPTIYVTDTDNRKDTNVVPRATVATQQLPGYKNSVAFGANLYNFPNREKIRGVYVTLANEEALGLGGLMNHIKGTSDVEPGKTIALVMVEQSGNGVKLVGVDGQPIIGSNFDKIVFQVMPDPKLQWSEKYGGKSMFREGTPDNVIKAITKEYTKFVEDTLESKELEPHKIEASFGIPQPVVDTEGKLVENARTGVTEAGLIKQSDLAEKPVIYVPTLGDGVISRGSTRYTKALGKPFLIGANGYVALQNKQHSLQEATLIYDAIYRLSEIKYTDGDLSSAEATRLLEWLRSVVYWGNPKNQAGVNSIWFDKAGLIGLKLNISNEGMNVPFSPIGVESNKDKIVEQIQKMYGNIRSAYVAKDLSNWNKPYEQITSVTADGKIKSKTWKNYQSYLLSTEGRTGQETPLTVPIRPTKGVGDTNREGIYFVVTDTADKYAGVVEKVGKEKPILLTPGAVRTGELAETATARYILDNQTPNVIDNPQLGKITFVADAKELETSGGKKGISLVQDDLGNTKAIEALAKSRNIDKKKATDLLVASIYQKVAPQQAAQSIAPVSAEEADIEKRRKEELDKYKSGDITVAGVKAINAKYNAELAALEKQPTTKAEEKQAAQIVTTTPDAEELIRRQLNSMGDDAPFRIKTKDQITKFEKEDWPKIEAFFKANFPNIPLYRVKNIIRGTNGLEAWGMLKNGGVYVYANAEVGTAYHEVFEAVWKMFSSPEERDNIVNEFKDRSGSFVDRITGQDIKYSNATAFQIKEQLAEEFRDFVQYGKVPAKPAKGQPFIVKLFNDLVNFIKSFFYGPQAARNTEELFKRMTGGFYKEYSPLGSQLSYAKNGIIDISDAYGGANSEYRIKDLPGQTVHDIMQQMTYVTLGKFTKNNKSLFTIPSVNKVELYQELKEDLQKTALKTMKAAEDLIDQGVITEEQAASTKEKSRALWQKITDNWEELAEKHKEYLSAYNIEFDNNNEAAYITDKAKEDPYGEATQIDNFKRANAAVKLLLSTIPIVREGKIVHSSINGATLLPTSQVFMAIMNQTHDSNSPDEMIEGLRKLAEDDENYRTLYERISKSSYNMDTFEFTDLKNRHDLQLVSALWRTFNKQSPIVKNLYILPNGEVQVGDSNFATAARQLNQDFLNAIVVSVKKQNGYFQYSSLQKAYMPVVDANGKAVISKFAVDTLDEQLNFLKKFGIIFNKADLLEMSGEDQDDFSESVKGIKKSFTELNKVATFSGSVLSINGRLLKLANIKAKIDNPEFDSVFYNVNGDATQSFIGVNALSKLSDVLSKAQNINDLRDTPYSYLLTDNFAKNSVILGQMFNIAEGGNRIKGTEKLMEASWADGTLDQGNGKKKQSSKLTYKQRLVQEINMNLAGYYYNLVPGDASLEHMVNMGNFISKESIRAGYSQPGGVLDTFRGYLFSEIELARETRPFTRNTNELRFFKDILGEELHDQVMSENGEVLTPQEVYDAFTDEDTNVNAIDEAITKYIVEKTAAFKRSLSNYGIITKGEEKETWFVENLAFAQSGTTTTENLNRELEMLQINFMINNIELHKLLYSDPYQYKDELKRIKSFLSPRQSIISNSASMNAALNNIWNEGFDEGDIGRTDFTQDYFRTATYADVLATGDLPGYEEEAWEETDGSGIITMKGYRNFRIRAGEWNDNEELQYKFDIAYEKLVKSGANKEEIAEFNKKNPSVKSAYTPLKPIVSGNKANGRSYNDIVLDKFALYPLSFRVLHQLNPESNSIKFYNKMQAENIDYTVFKSGRKVGAEELNEPYNENDQFNEAPYVGIVNVPFGIMSIQSEVPSKDESVVTRGSQITKLVTLDYMEAGVPVDFEPGDNFNQRLDKWNALKNKSTYNDGKNLYNEIKHNQELLEAMIDNGYQSLLKQMGIKELKNGKFKIADFSKAANLLRREILKREVNDNVADALAGFLEGKVVIEATPAYQQIRNILYSIADREVITPKMSGGQKVQIPSTFLEENRIKSKDGKGYTSDVLKFYTNKEGERVAEVMIGRWFDSNKTDAELLDYLNNTEEGQKILKGVAYRIPTQKQNSIDAIVIKQFLPREFGDSVVIPSALVKKAGSDFDIDKLFIYLKNTYKDGLGNIKLVPYYGIGDAAKEKFEDLYADISENKIKITQESKVKLGNLQNLLSDIALGEASSKTAEKWIPILQNMFGDSLSVIEIEDALMTKLEETGKKLEDLYDLDLQAVLMEKFVDRMYKKSLENEYIQSMENLITREENFASLTKPNSADQMKGLAKKITRKLGFESFNYDTPGNMLDRNFMSRLRQAFVSGKYAIGIAAVNQTNHSLNQRQPIYVDTDKLAMLDDADRAWIRDAKINFKDYNKIMINNKPVATLSMVKNAKGDNISDIIGQFIDGYVDISKGPWIMELGATPNTASTWLFLTKLGVPIEDVSYFMNQPIIRDYLRKIENSGYSWLFIDDFVKEMKQSPKYKVADNYNFSKITTIPSASKLSSLVGNNNLNQDQKAEQQFMLDEFLKYARMANQMFLVTQGSNFDTSTFNDPFLVFKKQQQLLKAQNTIISSVDDILKNSFLGKLAERIGNIRNAYAEILTSDKNNTRRVLENVLLPYTDMSDDEFVNVSRKAVTNLFDWAVQVDQKLNQEIAGMLLGEDNAAGEITDFVNKVKADPNHKLFDNIIVNLLENLPAPTEDGVNNIKIKNKNNKTYDQNQMIYGFKELKSYLGKDPIYDKLVRLSVLQSGIANSPISFTNLLPYEDFAKIYNKTLSKLDKMPNLDQFYKLGVFQRNNWADDDVVPYKKATFKQDNQGNWYYSNGIQFKKNEALNLDIQAGKTPQLVKIHHMARESKSDYIVYTWEEGTKSEKIKMRKDGDFSYIKKGLFKKVYNGDTPFAIKNFYGADTFIYKMINAWGDSYRANEFYENARESVIPNGFIQTIEKEDDDIRKYFEVKKDNAPKAVSKKVKKIKVPGLPEIENNNVNNC